MTNLRASLLAAACGILGVVVGVYVTGRSMTSMMNYGSAVSSLATVTVEGAALEKMATGDVAGAQQGLNINLDGHLIALRYAVDDGFVLPAGATKQIAKLADVRKASGYVPDPAVRAGVETAFERLIGKQ